MTANHKFYLDLAFRIAEKNLGKTKLNPSVGTVVVKNKSVISSGVTSLNGKPHAEFNALRKKKNYNGATLYTTLEPCTHYGQTPPCVNIIVKKKIKKVFYAFDDPDKRTYQKAKKILKKKKITIKLIKNFKFKNFYRYYFINKKKKLPLISAKIAISKDYLTISKKNRWITNEHSRKISHLLRSMYECIISTSKSINTDNSLLNCRINGFNTHKPDLFIIDLNLRLSKKLFITNLAYKRKTFLITNKINKDKTTFFKRKGFKIILVDSLKTKNDFKFLLKYIYELGYSKVFFETGLTFLNVLFKKKLLNNLYLFKSNNKLVRNGLNNASNTLLKKIKLTKKVKVNLKDDSFYKIDF